MGRCVKDLIPSTKRTGTLYVFLTVVLGAYVHLAPVSRIWAEPSVKVGLNYPRTGPYEIQGLDQWRAAHLAVEEINAEGGIMGRRVELVWRDSQSRPEVSVQNVVELIENERVTMVFGGSSSGVAVAVGAVCQEKGIPFFATLTYSTATTGAEGHRHTFRECYNSWMAAKAIGYYLNEEFPDRKYMYITADYTWGHTTESSFRRFTDTEDRTVHPGILVPFPDATKADFEKAVAAAAAQSPEVLVLVLFGSHMESAVRLASTSGLKGETQIVVPNLTLGMAEAGGPEAMEGVMGTVPWCWEVPYLFNYRRGEAFVAHFADRYDRYPSSSGASAYTILYEYKAAVERAGTFDASNVVRALEGRRYKFLVIPPGQGHEYTFLKDRQVWRAFDHQSVQTVYVVRCKPADQVRRDRLALDYFEILGSLSGQEAARTREEWGAAREAAGKPPYLEPLPGE